MEDDRERDPHISTLYGQDSGQLEIPTPDAVVQAELDGTPYPEEIARQSISISQFRSAPLPTPEEFGQYENVCPGAADRILKMSEQGLDAQTYAIKTGADAEAKSMRWVSASFAGSLPLSIGAIVVGAFLDVDPAIYCGAVIAALQLAPKFLAAIAGRKPSGQMPEEMG